MSSNIWLRRPQIFTLFFVPLSVVILAGAIETVATIPVRRRHRSVTIMLCTHIGRASMRFCAAALMRAGVWGSVLDAVVTQSSLGVSDNFLDINRATFAEIDFLVGPNSPNNIASDLV